MRTRWVPLPLVEVATAGSRRIAEAVIPAKAGIQRLQSYVAMKPWIPAFAGMTSKSAQATTAPYDDEPAP